MPKFQEVGDALLTLEQMIGGYEHSVYVGLACNAARSFELRRHGTVLSVTFSFFAIFKSTDMNSIKADKLTSCPNSGYLISGHTVIGIHIKPKSPAAHWQSCQCQMARYSAKYRNKMMMNNAA